MTARGLPARIVTDPQSQDLQALQRAARSYGPVDRDPENPVDGWWWIRRDLSPPQLRVKLGGAIYKQDFTAV